MSEQSQVAVLRAMAEKYDHYGHVWDYLDSLAVTRAANEIERLRTESADGSTTIDNIEAALGDARDPNLSLYENVLKLREEIVKLGELTDRQSVHISDLANEISELRAKAEVRATHEAFDTARQAYVRLTNSSPMSDDGDLFYAAYSQTMDALGGLFENYTAPPAQVVQTLTCPANAVRALQTIAARETPVGLPVAEFAMHVLADDGYPPAQAVSVQEAIDWMRHVADDWREIGDFQKAHAVDYLTKGIAAMLAAAPSPESLC